MIIKSVITLSAISLTTVNTTLFFNKLTINKIPYESLYNIDTIPNKNTMEYNTMTMEELIKNNNETISANPE
jgi:hypothetical protein